MQYVLWFFKSSSITAMLQFQGHTRPAITCSKLKIEKLEQGMKYVQSTFIVNFEHISHLVLVFLLLTLSR